ncbi:40767_t:CDS:2 [Gigaspora margarita]|uniref:40767_t:CDS:1 n=1 Tax=Gigaspora margarita TaxID=4874 RepID=A0ABN7V532_GIGMA|nr:40767_t:CDS:2 [Gigaspora margarita]
MNKHIAKYIGIKDNLEEAKKKIALLYTECGCLDYRVEDTKK